MKLQLPLDRREHYWNNKTPFQIVVYYFLNSSEHWQDALNFTHIKNYNMHIHNKDLSYYRLRLQELLNTSFPEKAHDVQFIDQRSSWAASAYEGAFTAGNPVTQCDQIAQHILFEGLHFSSFNTVFQVVCSEFDTRMADEELRPFSVKMLSVCAAVFTNYKLTDDFAYSADFDFLYTELTGTIAIWIEENGLQ